MKTLLSPKDLALAIGVSESSLKRWVDDGLIQVFRTAGGHRRIMLPEAIRFVRENHATVVRPDLLDMPELMKVPLDKWGGRVEGSDLLSALERGDCEAARALLLSLYLSGRSLVELCDGPIRDCMHKLGELWKHDASGIYIEHRATDICIQSLSHLRSLIRTPGEDAPVAVGGAVSGDPYILPSLMCALVLADAGFREVNLGPETPMDALISAAAHYRPKLVWLSVSIPDTSFQVREQIVALPARLHGTRVVLGGRGVEALSLPQTKGLRRVSSMSELADIARKLLPKPAAPST